VFSSENLLWLLTVQYSIVCLYMKCNEQIAVSIYMTYSTSIFHQSGCINTFTAGVRICCSLPKNHALSH